MQNPKKIRIKCASSSSVLSALVMRLMHSRTAAHVAHLTLPKSPGSLATHKALNSYYDEIVGLIDRLVEVHQGYTGALMQMPVLPYVPIENPSEPIPFFESLNAYVDEAARDTSQQALLNIIAEISELVCGTLYQLRFLQ